MSHLFLLRLVLGNTDFSLQNIDALQQQLGQISAMVDEHINWALEQQEQKAQAQGVPSRKLKRLIKVIKIGLPRDA